MTPKRLRVAASTITSQNISIDQFHKSQNAPDPYPTMLHSEQKCAHFCSECSIVVYVYSGICVLDQLYQPRKFAVISNN